MRAIFLPVVTGKFFADFFAKQHQAMLRIQGFLFWAFAVVFVGYLP
jgi:hypothetical protein